MKGIFADLVLRNATVLTMDKEDTRAEAVAVKSGVIVWVGSNESVKAFIGAETGVMDLAEKTVVPGFIDSHTHNVNVGEFSYNFKLLNLAAPLNPSIPDLLRRVQARAKETPPGGWVGGKYLDPYALAEQRWPKREELDTATSSHPVILSLRGGNACILNSMALKLSGITKDTPDPVGGVIEKDPATGEPTGFLRAKNLIKPALPRATLQDLKDGFAAISEEYARIGVTSTCDSGATDRPESYSAYQEAVAEGGLKTRTYLMINEPFYRANDLGLRTGFGNDRLRLGGIKLHIDGSIQCFTGTFHEPYLRKTTKGLEGLKYSQKTLNDVVTEVHRLGYQISIDAQGDYAITMAVNALETAMEKYPRHNPRHRIEHALCPRTEDLKRMKSLGVVVTFYVFHPWFWGDQHINNFIGEERAGKMVPIKTAMNMGIVSCAHSDCPVCWPNDPVWPSNPLWGMWCAVNRKTRSGADIGPQEKLTPMEALRAYTINGAYGTFEEGIKGSIEPGKLADMVILSDNPLEVNPWDIRHIQVEKTIIGGEVVYEKK